MILVTGAAGFIGSAVVWRLNELGRTDLLLAGNFRKGTKWKNLVGRDFVDFVRYDTLFEYLAVEQPKIDLIVHMGACSNTMEMDAGYMYETNTRFTKRLFLWAKERGVRFIYASSAAVYGDGSLGFDDDDALTSRLKPLNPYGFSKWLFDNWLVKTGNTGAAVGLRFFNVFGPHEYHKGPMASVLYRAFEMARTRLTIRLFKSHDKRCRDGEQKRDFVYVKDVIKVIEFFWANPGLSGIYNVGTGDARSFKDLAYALGKALKRPLQMEFFPMPDEIRAKYQYFTQAKVDKLRHAGYAVPFTPLYQSVGDYVTNYLAVGYSHL